MAASASGPSGHDPDALRAGTAQYVRALHLAYLDAAEAFTPGDRARLPLIAAGDVTVAAIGTRYLHILATMQPLPAPQGPEVEVHDAAGPLQWRLRFFDPVVVPRLLDIDESDAPQPAAVRDAVGLRTVVYQLTVPPGGGLSAHHAQHAGTGLAHAHASAARDYDTLRGLGADPSLVADMQGAEVAGLPRAVAALAALIAGGSAAPQATEGPADPVAARRQAIAALRDGPR